MPRPVHTSLIATLLCWAAVPPCFAAVRVDLLTMGRGPDPYARFGHVALHVHGDGRDLVYNFGYTRFGDEGLIWHFLRGKARFWVAVSSLQQTVDLYSREGRVIDRRRLVLSDSEHQALAEALRVACLPRNRYYTYHHFDDNCATRLRDLIDEVKDGDLRRRWIGRDAGLSYRDAVREGFAGRLDLLLLSELLLGRGVDRRIDAWEASFLPLRFTAQLEGLFGDSDPLAYPAEPLLVVRGSAAAPSGEPQAGVIALWCAAGIFGLLAGGGLAGLARRRRWAGVWLIPWALFIGLCGTLVAGLALVTTLRELRENELLLLLWPTDLLLVAVAVRWLRGRLVAGRLLRGYCLARVLAAGLVGAGHLLGLLHQQPRAWVFLVGGPALVLLLGVRSLPAPARDGGSGPSEDRQGHKTKQDTRQDTR